MVQRSNHWLREVDEFIDAHLHDSSLCIERIASSVYTSERQFYRRIKKSTGMTPNEYIRRRRLQRAYDIIRSDPPSSVSALAAAVGYNRADYFSRLFAKEYGKKPSEMI